jgi:ABC-2 type transport system ATP-binding protein
MRDGIMFAVRAENLVRKFGEFTAVRGISLEIEKGEIFGLLGPNGAGKTTTVKMLTSLIRPTSGYAEVWGHSVIDEPDQVRKCIGIVFQDPSLDFELTGRENLDFHARIYGLGKEERKKRIEEVLDLVELREWADELVKNYSGGMYRRLEIARGLMHHPRVLFLDEPTLGLDVYTRHRIWEYVKRLKEEGVTIILTTHYIEEADFLCDRVAIIDHGEIIALDAPKNLKSSVGNDVLTLEVADSDGKRLLELVQEVDFVKKAKMDNGFLFLSVEGGETLIPRLVELASGEGIVIRSISLRKPTLEDVFLHLTGRGLRDQKASSREQARLKAKMRLQRRGVRK